MGFRFRRSIKIAPGLRLNVSKNGVSASIGGRGLTTNLSHRGTRTTVSLPGTGLSWVSSGGSRRRAVMEQRGTAGPSAPRATAPSAVAPGPWWLQTLTLGAFGAWVALMWAVEWPWWVDTLCLLVALLGPGVWYQAKFGAQHATHVAQLSRDWALVRGNPADPRYAALLREWYRPWISDQRRALESVPPRP